MSYTLTVHAINDISRPTMSYNYYINPDKITATNSNVTLGAGWEKRASVNVIQNGRTSARTNSYGFVLTGYPDQTVNTSAVFRFYNAAQNTSTGQLYDFVISINSAYVYSLASQDRYISICNLNSEFWMEAYTGVLSTDTFNSSTGVITSEENWRVGVKLNISMYVANSSGAVSGTFAYPFQDIDATQDLWRHNGQYILVGGDYAESVVIHDGCPNVFVRTNTQLKWNNKTNTYPQTVTAPSIRFYNSSSTGTDVGQEDYTGIVGIFQSGSVFIQWTGCNCGTLFSDKALGKFTISYNANGGDNAPAAQYKIENQNITLSNQKPTRSTKIRWEGNGGNFSGATFTETTVSLEFLGWANTKAKADASIIDYPKDVVNIYTANASVTLYAVWGPGTVGNAPNVTAPANQRLELNKNWTTSKNGTTAITSNTSVPVSGLTAWAKWQYAVTVSPNGGKVLVNGSYTTAVQTTWKTYGVNVSINYTFKKSGATFAGLATTTSPPATISQPYTYSDNAPKALYAIWNAKKYVVRFRDGFTSRSGGKDIITRVEVNYGSSVPPGQVPVVGVEYPAPYQGNGGFFKKEGYTFAGWSGSYTNVKSNRDIVAMWGFSPIWVTKNSVWNSYEPDKVTISPYTVNNLVVHGTVADATSAGYTSPTGQDMSHSGQPPLCMKLVVENFKRNYDMSVSCDITTAALRAFPAHTPPMSYDRPLMVSACIVNGNITSVADAKTKFGTLDRYSETELFSKDTTATWADQSIKLTDPVTLSAPAPDSGQNAYLFICMSTDCDDTDSDETVPVYYYNLSTKVPAKPPGYFYRLENGSWVLRRPFYVCKTRTYTEMRDGQRKTVTEPCWCSCEDLSTPVYGADGHKIVHIS